MDKVVLWIDEGEKKTFSLGYIPNNGTVEIKYIDVLQ